MNSRILLKLLATVALAFACSAPVSAQEAPDRLFLTSGESLDVLVTEVLPDAVKYRRWSNRTGPVYTIPKADIQMVLYANGEHETFGASGAAEGSPPAAERQRPEPPPAEPVRARPAPEARSVDLAPGETEAPSTKIGLTNLSLGITELQENLIAFGLSSHVTRAFPIADKARAGFGYEVILNSVITDQSESGFFGLGARGYVDFALSDRATVYGAGGPLVAYGTTSLSGLGGGASTTVFTGYALVGARYRLGERFGVHAQVHSNFGPARFSFGFNREGPWRNWLTGP